MNVAMKRFLLSTQGVQHGRLWHRRCIMHGFVYYVPICRAFALQLEVRGENLHFISEQEARGLEAYDNTSVAA